MLGEPFYWTPEEVQCGSKEQVQCLCEDNDDRDMEKESLDEDVVSRR